MKQVTEEVAGTAEDTQPMETVTIDKELFKQLLKLALNSPNFASQITNVDVDTAAAPAGEVTMHLWRSVELLLTER